MGRSCSALPTHGDVVGLEAHDPRDTIDRVTQLVSDRVRPLVNFHPELADVDGRRVLLVRVNPGAEPPYGVGTTDRRIDYYVRRGATTFPATPTDVRAFVRAHTPSPAPFGYLPR